MKTPRNKPSKLYIIIKNDFFKGVSEDLFQIHIESGQIKNKSDRENLDIYEKVVKDSEPLANFFYTEFFDDAKCYKGGFKDNKYLKFLVNIGFTNLIFDLFDVDTPSIQFHDFNISKLCDLKKFTNLDQLIVINSNLNELTPSIGELIGLEMLVLPKNKLVNLPKEIGKLRNLLFLNIIGNPIKDIPDEIKYLDTVPNLREYLNLCFKKY
jgi:Leucine-rich repeat (LRR) protein